MRITQSELKELMRYNPTNGLFIRLITRGRNGHVGRIAGSVHADGYAYIGISGRNYKTHRLAWLYMTGKWPRGSLDHKNGSKADNRWKNLRTANRSQNGANRAVYASNKVGLKGVRIRGTKFLAQIKHNKKVIHLGVFATAKMAHKAYCAAAKRRHKSYARP